jgi:hypothetical protein
MLTIVTILCLYILYTIYYLNGVWGQRLPFMELILYVWSVFHISVKCQPSDIYNRANSVVIKKIIILNFIHNNQESELSCICHGMLGLSNFPLSTSFLLDFGNVPTVMGFFSHLKMLVKMLGYFVWKITILRQKNHIFSNYSGAHLPGSTPGIS